MQITLLDCGKSFNRKWLFKHLDCQLNAGEQWAILGSNGSGKSTFCLMLAAQVWPTEGTVQWQYQNCQVEPTKVFSHIALASPALELPEEFSFHEIIQMHKRAKPFLAENAGEEIAALCGFDTKTMLKPLYSFSSGMKQRARLSLAAMSDTPVLILDEPLTNLDSAGVAVYEKIVGSYAKDRLLVVASNREDEYSFCNRKLEIYPDGSVKVD